MARLFDVRCPEHGRVAAKVPYPAAIATRREHWTSKHPVAARKWQYGDEAMPMPSRPTHILIKPSATAKRAPHP